MNESKSITKLVQSMRRALKADHGLEVPYTALRASLLKANGEHPHAFGRKDRAEDAVTPASADYAKLMFQVVENEAGIMELLAVVGEFSEHVVPDDWTFEDAYVVAMEAEIPSIKRYGLPDHLDDPEQFFAYHGLKVAFVQPPAIVDLGDDSGGSARLLVVLPLSERTRLLKHLVKDEPGLEDEVAGYVAEQYQLWYPQMSDEQRARFFLSYLCIDEDAWFPDFSDDELLKAVSKAAKSR